MVNSNIEWEIEIEFNEFKNKLQDMFPDLETWEIRDVLEPLLRMM